MFGIFDIWTGASKSGTNPGAMLAVAGSAFLMVALMIFAFPELVAYLVATALFWVGGVALILAFRIRKSDSKASDYRYYEII